MNPSIRTTVATVALLLAAVSAQSQTRYTYSSAGDEVTDSKTGLIWRRCSEGQTWSGSTCNGTAATYTHEQALAQAQAQAGTAGWRLPNVKELTSIAEKTHINPAIDPAAFPATPLKGHWSSTPYAVDSNNAGHAWVVRFGDGYVNAAIGNRTFNFFPVRLVR